MGGGGVSTPADQWSADRLPHMEALGTAAVCIGDWVEQHKRVLGTRRVVGPGLVLQAATLRASDEQLTFDATTTFAHIRVTRQVFSEGTGSCLSDMIYPIVDANPNLFALQPLIW